MRQIFIVALALLATLLVQPFERAWAQDAQQQVLPLDGYERLFNVLTDDPDRTAVKRLAQLTVRVMASQNTLFGETEAEQPGFLAELQASIVPVTTDYVARIQALHRPRFVASIREAMSEEDAVKLAEFYESDLGQLMLETARANLQIEATTERLLSDDPFTEAETRRDSIASRDAAIRALSAEDIVAVESWAAANPGAAANLAKLRQPMITFRTAMDNEPLTASEEAGMNAAMSQVVARYGLEFIDE